MSLGSEDRCIIGKVSGIDSQYVSSWRRLIHPGGVVESGCSALASGIEEVEAKGWKDEGNEVGSDY